MINKKIEISLNNQVKIEAESSQAYLAMAIWAECNGLNGIAIFLYEHSDEERLHMLKLVKFINERGGTAIVPPLSKPATNFKGVKDVFNTLLSQEVAVTKEINELVDLCLSEKDYTTHNFLQWYVSEQIEEEALARNILDKIELIGNDKGGLYLFDRDLQSLAPGAQQGQN